MIGGFAGAALTGTSTTEVVLVVLPGVKVATDALEGSSSEAGSASCIGIGAPKRRDAKLSLRCSKELHCFFSGRSSRRRPRLVAGWSIRELAELIADVTGYEGRITWDTEEPNGQPRRSVDASRARELFGFEAHTSLRESRTRTCAERYQATVRSIP